MPAFRYDMVKRVTIFGAESCGKTTASRYIAGELDAYLVPEWARGYLETVGPELTEHKMLNIARGQFAAQMVPKKAADKLFIVQDTDLLSTIGYYRILGWKVPMELLTMFAITKADLYVLMDSNIPFEADILRYGGDKRESTDQFWIDLLEEFDCNYVVMKSDPDVDGWNRASDTLKHINKTLIDYNLADFKRD